MTNPIQLLRDFRKWREKRRDNLIKVIKNIAAEEYPPIETDLFGHRILKHNAFAKGVLYGIERRKEILKQVKI